MTSAFVRTHLASFAKRRARAYYSHRAFTTCAASSLGKAEELDLWHVKDGKLIERWNEFNLLEVFKQIAAAMVRKAEGQCTIGFGCCL